MADRGGPSRGSSRGRGRGAGAGYHHHNSLHQSHYHQHNQNQHQNRYQHSRSYRGGGGRGGVRGGRGSYGQQHQHQQYGGASGSGTGERPDRPKKESILDLKVYMGKSIEVKFNGGREATGILRGFDALMNLVLDEVQEKVRDDQGNERTRPLGLVVVRGTQLAVISPTEGAEVIANPFVQ